MNSIMTHKQHREMAMEKRVRITLGEMNDGSGWDLDANSPLFEGGERYETAVEAEGDLAEVYNDHIEAGYIVELDIPLSVENPSKRTDDGR